MVLGTVPGVKVKVEVLVTQLCPTLCDPVDYSPPGSPPSMGFSRQEYWSGLPCPPPGDLPHPGIKVQGMEDTANRLAPAPWDFLSK